MNTLLGIVWGLVNPDMFQAVADTLEDVMQGMFGLLYLHDEICD
jgi:Ca2+-dependent lipid-binding protein